MRGLNSRSTRGRMEVDMGEVKEEYGVMRAKRSPFIGNATEGDHEPREDIEVANDRRHKGIREGRMIIPDVPLGYACNPQEGNRLRFDLTGDMRVGVFRENLKEMKTEEKKSKWRVAE